MRLLRRSRKVKDGARSSEIGGPNGRKPLSVWNSQTPPKTGAFGAPPVGFKPGRLTGKSSVATQSVQRTSLPAWRPFANVSAFHYTLLMGGEKDAVLSRKDVCVGNTKLGRQKGHRRSRIQVTSSQGAALGAHGPLKPARKDGRNLKGQLCARRRFSAPMLPLRNGHTLITQVRTGARGL